MRFLDRLVYVQAFSRVATPRCRLLCSRICDRTTIFACVTGVDRCGLLAEERGFYFYYYGTVRYVYYYYYLIK